MYAILLRCCKLDIHGPDANFWEDLELKITECIRNTLDRRVQFYEDEIRKLTEQRFMPIWNFCNFFILKVISLLYFRKGSEMWLLCRWIYGLKFCFFLFIIWFCTVLLKSLMENFESLLLSSIVWEESSSFELKNTTVGPCSLIWWNFIFLKVFMFNSVSGKFGFHIWDCSSSWRCFTWIWWTRALLFGNRFFSYPCVYL